MIIIPPFLIFLSELAALAFIKNPSLRKLFAGLAFIGNAVYVLFSIYLLSAALSGSTSYTILFIGYMLVWAALFTYRTINMLRLYIARMQFKKLYHLVLQTKLFLDIAVVAMIAAPFFAAELFNRDVVLIADVIAYVPLVLSSLLVIVVLISLRKYKAPGAGHTITDRTAPTVSLLIPAKDESEELLDCLDLVVESDYPKLEVIVLDDCSTNPKTADIIKQYANKGVRFVSGTPPDARWLGKNNAYEELSSKAHGDWLIFMGSDIRIAKHTIRNIIDRLEGTEVEMMSVMPLRMNAGPGSSITPLRFFYELALPRFLTGKPAVMSSLWAVRADRLRAFGGFKGVSRSIIPERHIADSIGSKYRFWLANTTDLAIGSAKSADKQHSKAIRQRYPQAKRRLERTFVFSLLLSTLGIVPLLYIVFRPVESIASLVVLGLAYSLSERRLTTGSLLRIVLAAPLSINEVLLMNYSMLKYEFGEVYWKGRNVCIPVMRVYQKLPKV